MSFREKLSKVIYNPPPVKDTYIVELIGPEEKATSVPDERVTSAASIDKYEKLYKVCIKAIQNPMKSHTVFRV